MITSDSVRADHCSCYAYMRDTTPFLTKLAQSGLKFENPIVGGVATIHSMYCIVTSRHCPFIKYNPKLWKESMRYTKTIFDVIIRANYTAITFSPNPFFSPYSGLVKGACYLYRQAPLSHLRGWDKFKELIKRANLYLLERFGVAGDYMYLKSLITGKLDYPRVDDYYHTILDSLSSTTEPYFLWLFLTDTHFPYVPPREFSYSGIGTRRALWLGLKMHKNIPKAELRLNRIFRGLSERERRLIIDCYDGEIRHVDSILEQLWRDLKDTDPIIIVHSDHGESFGEHGFYGHPTGEHYEYLIRVPLVIYNADVKGVVKEPVSLLRLAPTICELAGVENEFSQPSLLEDVEYTPPIVENKLENGLRVTVRDKEWKLIVNPDREDELYNIKKDPMEQENLIGQEPDIEKELRKLAEKHIKTRKEKERLRKRIERLRGI